MFHLTRESLEGWSNPAHRGFPRNSLVCSLSLGLSWGGGYTIRDRTTCFIAVYTYAVSTPTPAVTAPIYKQCCGNYIERLPGSRLLLLSPPFPSPPLTSLHPPPR